MWATVRPLALVAAWLACGWCVWQRADHAWGEFADDTRSPANKGYVQIDFAGQWVMGRMFAADGRHLYHRGRLRGLVDTAFPVEREAPHAPAHDADRLMDWFVDAGGDVGGPLYPPVHGLLYAPLARLDPYPAYRLFQAFSVGLAVFAGLAVSRASGGRVWPPLAVAGVLAFPGARGGLDLAQNHMLTLAVLAGGWWAMTRGRWTLGGAVWGLLAIKPTWAVAFLPVLVLMGRWRAAGAMCGVAAGLVLLTLPVVGVGGWLDWLAVGREASRLYAVNENWISLSRDLSGLPRRLLIDFTAAEDRRGSPLAATLGWALWAAVVSATAVVYRLRRDGRPAGLPAGFLLLGAYLGCYRFMYYDAALAALPVGLVLADRRSRGWLPLGLVALLFTYENVLMHARLRLVLSWDGVGWWGRPGQRLLSLTGDYQHAWDTAFLLALWLWAGWRLLSRPAEGGEGGPDVGGPHERLADQHR